MKALEQRVVQLPGNSRALSDARVQGHVELVLHVPHAKLVRPRQERQEQSRERGTKPGGPPPGRRDENRQRRSFIVP